jgi:putative phage-type endonuclease
MDYVKEIEIRLLLQNFTKNGIINKNDVNNLIDTIKYIFNKTYDNTQNDKLIEKLIFNNLSYENDNYSLNYERILSNNTPDEEYKSILRERVRKLRAQPQPEQRTQEWYDIRKRMVTASDIATVLGHNPYARRKEVILKKCNVGKPFTGNKYTHHGVKYEPIATMFYEMLKKTTIIEFGLIPHPELSYLGASPDGITPDGIMLEIKCPFTRKINTDGILQGVPLHYWIQMQIQMEACNLETCDFLQCEIVEYPDEETFLKDKDHHQKGAIIETIDNTINDYYKRFDYIYPHNCYINTKEDLDVFVEESKSKYADNPNIEYHNILYWKLVKHTCVSVKRDRVWFLDNLPEIKKFWDDVMYYRKNGVKELLPPPKEIDMSEISTECLF